MQCLRTPLPCSITAPIAPPPLTRAPLAISRHLAQVSVAQQDRILNYLSIGEKEGAKVLTGGAKNDCISGGYYIKPCACAALSPRAASLAPRLRRRPQPRPHQDHPLGDQQHEGVLRLYE